MEGNSRKASEEGIRSWPHRGGTSLGALTPFFQMMPLRPSFTPFPALHQNLGSCYGLRRAVHITSATSCDVHREEGKCQPGWGAQDEQVVDTTLVIVHKRNKPLFLKNINMQKPTAFLTSHSLKWLLSKTENSKFW